jgi:hypothetical protein
MTTKNTRTKRARKPKPTLAGATRAAVQELKRKGATLGEVLADLGAVPKGENGEIRRAAERAGIKATPPAGELPDISELDAIGVGLTDEDKALLAQRAEESGHTPKVAEHVMRSARVNGNDTKGVALALWREARHLESIAERLTPSRETRDSMLADALEVIEAAEQIFYVEGDGDRSEPVDLMREALHAAEQEFDLFSAMKESRGSELHWQELWRASYRAKLARLLADFRRTHGVYKPTKKDEQDETAVAS